MAAYTKIPVLYLQCDWDEVLRNGHEAWVTCKFRDQPGIHGNLYCEGVSCDGIPYVSASEGYSVGQVTKKKIEVIHTASETQCTFIAPDQKFNGIHLKSVVCLDVNAGGLGVSVCSQNKLHVWETSRGLCRRTLDGHVGDVYSCRLFPSGVVVLSAGADMQIKIWSAETGQCPVTLTGHKAAIMDTAIVGRGRNIISVSKDGTAKLWDCGQSAFLATLMKTDTFINSCDLGMVGNHMDLGNPQEPPSAREVGTDGLLLLAACEDGTLRAAAVHSHKELFTTSLSSAVNCVSFLSPTNIICGCHDGCLYLIDPRKPKEPVCSWLDSESPVLSLLPYKEGFFAGRGDGTCIHYSLEGEKLTHLTGSDCDPIYKIAYDEKSVYTACRDSIIRKYNLESH